MRTVTLWELLAAHPHYRNIHVEFDGGQLDIVDVQQDEDGTAIIAEMDGWVLVPKEPEQSMVDAAMDIEFRRIDTPEITDAMIAAGIEATLLPPDKLRAAWLAMWAAAEKSTTTTGAGIRKIWDTMLHEVDGD